MDAWLIRDSKSSKSGNWLESMPSPFITKWKAAVTTIFAIKSQVRPVRFPTISPKVRSACIEEKYIQFLGYAKASAGETRNQLYLAADLGFIAPERTNTLQADARLIGGKLYALIRSLRGS